MAITKSDIVVDERRENGNGYRSDGEFKLCFDLIDLIWCNIA